MFLTVANAFQRDNTTRPANFWGRIRRDNRLQVN